MAGEIIKGLFGISPYELSQQHEQEGRAQDYRLAQLSPEQMLQFHAVGGARDMANGIRDVFNVQDPQMKEATLLDGTARQLSQMGVDLNTSKGLQQLMQELQQKGASPESLQRIGMAAQQYAIREQQMTAQAEMPSPVLELLKSGKYTPDSVSAFKSTGDFSVLKFQEPNKEAKRSSFAQQLIDEGLDPGSQAFQERMRQYNLADIQGTSKKGQTTVTLNQALPPDKKKLGEAAGTEVGKGAAGVGEQYQIVDSSRAALALLDKGIYTGPYAEASLLATKLTRGAMGDLNKVARTESFLNSVKSNVIPMLAAFGGNDSNEEKNFLIALTGGQITAEPEAIRSAIISGMKKAQARIDRLRAQVKSAEEGKSIPFEIDPNNDPMGLAPLLKGKK